MSANKFGGFSRVSIENIRLTSITSKKSADITRLVKRIDIQQSILDPTMVGTMVIEDPTGIVYDLPLIGEEILSVSLKSEISGAELQKDFFIHKPSDIQRNPSQQTQVFTLHFVSLDHIKAISTIIEQGFNLLLSDIVENILTSKLGSTNNIIEPTRGTETLIIPGWNILDSIEFLRQRAVSSTYDSPYFFFETLDGFNFVSLEYMIEKQKDSNNIINVTAQSFNMGAGEDANKTTIDISQYRNAENFHIIKKTDTAALVNSGGISSRTRVYNVLEKQMYNVDVDYQQFATDVVKKPLDKTYNPHHSNFLKGITPTPTTRFTVPFDKTNPSAFANNVGYKQMFNKHLGDNLVSFTLFGDASIKAGSLINIEIPRVSSRPETDEQLSGLYIVSKLNHAISDDQMFTQIEANKFGHMEKVLS